MGGSTSDLIVNANVKDLTYLNIADDCNDNEFMPFLQRTLFNSYKLCNQIHLSHADYLKTIKNIYISNINTPPTFFIEPESIGATTRTVDGYFSNLKPELQTYIINPGTLTTTLEGVHATVYAVVADQLYSNSARSGLYDINSFYLNCEDDGYDHWSELHENIFIEIDNGACPTNMGTNKMCVNVPPYAVGYFEFTYDIEMRLGISIPKMSIYPNPSASFLNLQFDDVTDFNNNAMEILVIASSGQVVLTQNYTASENTLDINDLPTGIYMILLTNKESIICSSNFVKAE